jgi:hypothetical protein
MRHTDLQDRSTGKNSPAFLDLDGDAHRDLGFSTYLVGDPQLPGSKTQFYAHGSFITYFPINAYEESPILSTGSYINDAVFPAYNWYNAPAILLAQRIELLSGTNYWEGRWKNTEHRFLPFYVLRNNKRYFGWIELSFNMSAQKVILHQAAVSTEPDKGVKAGIK